MSWKLDKRIFGNVFDGKVERLRIQMRNGKEFLVDDSIQPSLPGARDAEKPLEGFACIGRWEILNIERDLVIRSDHKHARLDKGVAANASGKFRGRDDEEGKSLLGGFERKHTRHRSVFKEAQVSKVLNLVHGLIVRSFGESGSDVHVAAAWFSVCV